MSATPKPAPLREEYPACGVCGCPRELRADRGTACCINIYCGKTQAWDGPEGDKWIAEGGTLD